MILCTSFSRGPHTLAVSVKLHQLNRSRLVSRLKEKGLISAGSNDVILLRGAKFQYRHCSNFKLWIMINHFLFDSSNQS